MKLLQTLFIAASAIVFFSSCNNYGKEYKLDKSHNVYYKGDGVDEALAKKLADYLKQESYFQNGKIATVQLQKRKDTFDVNFVVDEKMIDATKEKQFIVFGGYISKHVFNSAPTCINLTNDHLEPVNKLGYAAPAEEATPAVPAQ